MRANGRASGPVLTFLFLFVPDHSEAGSRSNLQTGIQLSNVSSNAEIDVNAKRDGIDQSAAGGSGAAESAEVADPETEAVYNLERSGIHAEGPETLSPEEGKLQQLEGQQSADAGQQQQQQQQPPEQHQKQQQQEQQQKQQQ